MKLQLSNDREYILLPAVENKLVVFQRSRKTAKQMAHDCSHSSSSEGAFSDSVESPGLSSEGEDEPQAEYNQQVIKLLAWNADDL